MDYQEIAVAFHLIGFALGLGGATISDITFFKILRKGQLTREDYGFLRTLSKVIWLGLYLLIISGLMIFALIYSEQGSLPMLAAPRWQTKLALVAVVFINGQFFMRSIFPALKNLIGTQLTKVSIEPIINKLAISGTISILSWYSIFVVTLLPRSFRPHLLYFFGTYLILLLVGVIISKTMIRKTINNTK